MYMVEEELLSVKGFRVLQDLVDGTLTHSSFHSKKGYARRSRNLQVLIDLTCAWVLYKVRKDCI